MVGGSAGGVLWDGGCVGFVTSVDAGPVVRAPSLISLVSALGYFAQQAGRYTGRHHVFNHRSIILNTIEFCSAISAGLGLDVWI